MLTGTVLNVDVERGAAGGPTFQTIIKQHQNGRETRYRVRTKARQRWNLGYGIANKTILIEPVRSVFYNAYGRWDTFLVRDVSDYELDDDYIGTGDGVQDTFQIIRQYITTGGQVFTRDLNYVDDTTVVVRVDGSVVNPSNYTVSATGQVIFDGGQEPGNGLDVTVDCEFWFLGRIDFDNFEVVLATIEAGEVPDVPVIEVIGE